MKLKQIIQKRQKDFGEAEKNAIIQELIETQSTKAQIWEKYTGQSQEHGRLLRWMEKLGYATSINTRSSNIVSNTYSMRQKKNKAGHQVNTIDESFETLQLKNRIADLEKQLKAAELKAIALGFPT